MVFEEVEHLSHDMQIAEMDVHSYDVLEMAVEMSHSYFKWMKRIYLNQKIGYVVLFAIMHGQ